jgi:putative nucleotidyltransferase with HDIG domain
MRDKIKNSLADLLSAVKVAKFYSTEHPQFKDFIGRAFDRLQEIFKKRSEIVIGIVDGELAFEHEIFFDVSEKLRPLLLFLQQRGIEKIAFHRDMDKEELSKFISFLTTRRKKGEKGAQELLDFLGVRNIKAGEIKGPSSEQQEGVKEQNTYSSNYEESLDTVSQSLETVMDNEEIDYLELRYNLAANFTGDMMERYQEFLNMTPEKKKELVAFTHLLNVSILSMYVASKMGYSRDDVLDIGTAALFHDIGNIYITHKLKRENDVSGIKDEVNNKKHHSFVGAEILLGYMDKLGALPAIVAFEHHLRYDLKGEPRVSFPQKLNPVSMIISMCDAYDTLVQRRTREDEYPPHMIYNLISKERGRLYDPELLDRFLKIMGVWPVGTIVSLSDESIAVVREQNENDAYRPKVEVIHPQEQKEFIDLAQRGGDIKIGRSLDSIEERKKYLHLINPD